MAEGASTSKNAAECTVPLSKLLELQRLEDGEIEEADVKFSPTPYLQEWILDMESLIHAAPLPVNGEACIYRVPAILRDSVNSNAYAPRWVPLGPYHHMKTTQEVNDTKEKVMVDFIRDSGKSTGDFLKAVFKVLDELKRSYSEPPEVSDDDFAKMMLTDGIFLLDFMSKVQYELDEDASASDSNAFYGSLMNFRADAICIENQVPLRTLYEIDTVKRGTALSFKEMNHVVLDFLGRPRLELEELGRHCLDLLHKSYVGVKPVKSYEGELCSSMASALFLNEAGVSLRKIESDSVNDIQFEKGYLRLPRIHLHSQMEVFSLNLMAFEHLRSTEGHAFMSYVSMMDNLVNKDEDVLLLSKKGILTHSLGDDKTVAEMFNKLNKGRALHKNSFFHLVQKEVNEYCQKRRHWWWANIIHTQWANPSLIFNFINTLLTFIIAVTAITFTLIDHRKDKNQ